MLPLLAIAAVTLGALLLGAGLLHAIPRLGGPGRSLSAWLCRAPGLDWLVTYFTVLPLIAGAVAGVTVVGRGPGGDAVTIGPWAAGFAGLGAAIAGQVGAVMLWTVLHELAHPKARRGPRIVHQLNRTVGRFRNHAAVWTTALAVPVFWIIRVAELIVYPPLTVLVKFPRYNSGEWINVSRQKFDGLVGHDLIWCLYCDWMTGVWSLASEMLRNVESFWCPIRFRSDKKCANCAHDFPDVIHEWAPSDGSMGDVVEVLAKHYHRGDPVHAWFGHPVRITVRAKEVPDTGNGGPREPRIVVHAGDSPAPSRPDRE